MTISQALAAILIGLSAVQSASAAGSDPQLLYDVDFNAHAVGQPPPTDNGPFPRSAPSSISINDPSVEGSLPIVVDDALGLTDQPLSFQYDGVGLANEQVIFHIGDLAAPIYRFDVDLSITGAVDRPLQDDATLFLDMPVIFPIRFGEDGHGDIFSTRFDYVEGAPFHVTAIVDFSLRTWQVTIGDTFLAGPLDYSGWTDLRSVRFATHTQAVAALDNFRLWAIPEPGTGVLVLVGLIVLTVRRR